jgi:hypothetical protein
MVLNEILILIKSPTFWFSTVFVSILVSLIGNFLYSLFQNLWAKFSSKHTKKNIAKQKIFDDLVLEAYQKGIRVSDMEIHSIYSTLWNLLFLIVLLIIVLFLNAVSSNILISQTIVVVLWLVIIFIANRSINTATFDRKLIKAVQKLYSLKPNVKVDHE